MMKVDDRIYKYLSGMLDEKSLSDFEKEISHSIDLQEQLDFVKSKMDFVGDSKSIELDKGYFNNLTPRIREKLNKKQSLFARYKLNIVLPSAISVVLLLILLNPFNKTNNVNFDNMFVDFDGIELSEEILLDETQSLSNIYRVETIDSSIIGEIYDESLNELAASQTINGLDENLNSFSYMDYASQLEEDEFVEIYEALLNKKIL